MASLPDYGIDAPGVIRGLAIGGVVLLIAGTGTGLALQGSQPATAGSILRSGLWWGGSWLLTATIMFWSSRVGKLRVRESLLDSLRWSGQENVLDVGCGSGLALIGAAKRLKTGRAIGIDIWSTDDLTGNTPE